MEVSALTFYKMGGVRIMMDWQYLNRYRVCLQIQTLKALLITKPQNYLMVKIIFVYILLENKDIYKEKVRECVI